MPVFSGSEELLKLVTFKKIQHNPSADDLEDLENYVYNKEEILSLQENQEAIVKEASNKDSSQDTLHVNIHGDSNILDKKEERRKIEKPFSNNIAIMVN